MRPVQHFTDDYLAQCRDMSPQQIAQFVDDFRLLHGGGARGAETKLISLRVPVTLLRAFRAAAETSGVAYQTQIKRLMEEWIGVREPDQVFRKK